MNKTLVIGLLAIMTALLGGFAWWWSVRLDSNSLHDAVVRDAGRSATFTAARILHLESGLSSASANLVLHYQYQHHYRRVPADLRLQRIGKRWHIIEVFAGNRQYSTLERLGHDVGLSLASEYALEQTKRAVEDVGEVLESLGDAAIREGRKAAEALRKKWDELDHDG